jgi:hypothetical protein
MDYSACVVKSDKLLNSQLTKKLKAAVASLENVPEHCRDWHPGSDEKVLDLVHPSLWPLIYGKSQIVADEYIPLNRCLEFCGGGITIPTPLRPRLARLRECSHDMRDRGLSEKRALSTAFQWLPCDIDIAGEKPRIMSYINNLHPVRHADLYLVIEELIEKALPAWVARHPEALTFSDWRRSSRSSESALQRSIVDHLMGVCSFAIQERSRERYLNNT